MSLVVNFLIFVGIASLGAAWTALRGIRASDEELRAMAKLIGTRNPRLARIICWVGFLICAPVGVGVVGTYVYFFIEYHMTH